MEQDLHPAVPPKLIMTNIILSLSRTCIRAVLVTDTAPVGFLRVTMNAHAFGRPHKSIRPASICRASTCRSSLRNDLRGYYS